MTQLWNVYFITGSLSEVSEEFHPETLIKFDDIFRISTMFKMNTEGMKHRLRKLLDIYADLEKERLSSELESSPFSTGRDSYEDSPLGREYNKGKIA